MGAKITVSGVAEGAFEEQCVGMRVRDATTFMSELESAVAALELPESGHARVPLNCLDAVYSGVAWRHQLELGDCVVRKWRDEPTLFACRKMALEVKRLVATVCTREAFLRDRLISAHEALRVAETECQYVLLAVHVDPPREWRDPLSSRTFVRCLAGDTSWLAGQTVESIAEMSREIAQYEREFVTVSD